MYQHNPHYVKTIFNFIFLYVKINFKINILKMYAYVKSSINFIIKVCYNLLSVEITHYIKQDMKILGLLIITCILIHTGVTCYRNTPIYFSYTARKLGTSDPHSYRED